MRTLLAAVTLLLAFATPALADGPGSGTPNVVTLGDSAISGEAGRWAGSTNQSSSRVDALGSHAYNGGAVRGGSCVRVANGLNAQGEPVMGLQ